MPDDKPMGPTADADGRSSGWLTRLWGRVRLGGHGGSLRDQIADAIDEAEEGDATGPQAATGTDLSPIERKMLRNMLHFGELRVDDVCVPRADIIAIADTSDFAAMVAAFADAGHSRLPVYRGDLDNIIGMVHVKDVFAVLAAGGTPPPLAELLRQPRYVPQSMAVLDLLAEMRSTRTHLAVVIDEYSGTEGLVTIEDLVEEIVGDIEDEHDDEPETMLTPEADGTWLADARAELDDVGEAIDPALAEVEDDIDTLGGLAAMLAGHVPAPGEVVEHPSGWRLEILAGDDRRVRQLRLVPPPRDAA